MVARWILLATTLSIGLGSGCSRPVSTSRLTAPIADQIPVPNSKPLTPGWIVDAQTGCAVWNPFPIPNESVSWTGSCPGGIAQGFGAVYWFKDGQPLSRGGGTYRDGRLSGQGTTTWHDGTKYVGAYLDGKWSGHGTLTRPDGGKYEGAFREGKRNGYGTYTWPDGRRFVGEYRDDKRNGRGLEYSSDATVTKSGIWDNNILIKSEEIPQNNSVRTANSAALRSAEIKLVRDGGTFKVPVIINGSLILHFVIDSGASDVSIPADVVLTLMRTGTLKEEDFLVKRTYRLADGSTVPSETFRIRSLKVGDRVVRNVTGSTANIEGSLLLGQSFLSTFRSWSIDNNRQLLILE